MLAELGRVDSISARLRQRTRVGGRVLIGTGRYLQQGRGVDQRFRFEMVLEADSERFELLELADGLIVGSALKHDGLWSNAIDPARAQAIVNAVK